MENQLKEIDQLETVKILNKRKRIIISFALMGLIIGFVWFFSAPFEYNGEVNLQIGRVFNSEGIMYYIEDPHEVTAKIEKEVYGNSSFFTVDNIEKTALIEIRYSGNDYKETESRLNELTGAIIKKHEEIFNKQKDRLEKRADFLRKEMVDMDNEISFLLARGGQQIEYLKAESYKINLLLDSVESQISRMEKTRIIKGPVISETKRSPYPTILLGFLLGIFLGFILVFLVDWFYKNREKI